MIKLHKAKFSDQDFARSIHHIAYRDVIISQFNGWDEKRQDKFFDDDWSAEKFEIIEFNGIKCGYYSADRGVDSVEIVEIVLHPDYQKMGIGTMIIQDEIETARIGRKKLTLKTLIKNKAQNLYNRLGFKYVGRTETHVIMELTFD